MKTMKLFLSALLAGISIGLGGVVFLSVESKVVGAFLFAVGLFMVCTFGFHLFTGKVCYVFQNGKDFALGLPVIWLGNLCGTGLTAGCVALTRNAVIAERALALWQTKLGDNLCSLFSLGILCNIFIYVAVEGYNKNPHELGKYLSILFGVIVFILAGTEHCVADMFYLWMSGAWCGRAVVSLLVITAGNAVGGVLFPVIRSYINK